MNNFTTATASLLGKNGRILAVLALIGGLSFSSPLLAQAISAAEASISTIAGGWVGDGGAAGLAGLNGPHDVARDVNGNLYIADRLNHRIRKVSTGGVVTTFAGTGISGHSGDDGPAASAMLHHPSAVAIDASGSLLIADSGNNRIRKVTTAGVISTIAGTGTAGSGGDAGAAVSAMLNAPEGIAVDSAGVIYVSELAGHRVRKFVVGGTITTVAGNGVAGYSGDNGPGASASLNSPKGLALDSAGNLLIADFLNHRVRRLSPDGLIITAMGTGAATFRCSGETPYPQGITVGAGDWLYVSDDCGVQKMPPGGAASTVINTGLFADPLGDGGDYHQARLLSPAGLDIDSTGNLYVTDSVEQRVRKLELASPYYGISTVAGPGLIGDGRPAVSAGLNFPAGMAHDSAGNLYIADAFNHRIRKVSQNGTISTVAGTGTAGFSGDGGLATAAQLNSPTDVAVDGSGNLWIADSQNFRVRRVAQSGVVSTVAGTGFSTPSGDGGLATAAGLGANSVVVDANGNLYIADFWRNRIRKVGPDSIISTFAGSGAAGFSGDGGPATAAMLSRPSAMVIDAAGNLLVADNRNHRIRKVAVSGIITTVAGNGSAGFSGDGAVATAASLNFPRDIAVDAGGNIFIADQENHRIRRISPGGMISSVAGNGSNGFSGDNGDSLAASLAFPAGVVVDAEGNLVVSDERNNRVRMVAGATTPNAPSLSLGDASVAEGDSGVSAMTFTVHLNRAIATAVTFDVASVNGTAASGSDYVALSLTGQSIPAGATSTTVAVMINGDTDAEPIETFSLNISNVSGAAISKAQAIGTIYNDELFLSISEDLAMTEGNTAAQIKAMGFVVNMTSPSQTPVTFDIALVAGSATPYSDYIPGNQRVTIPPGQSSVRYWVGILGDIMVEPDETFGWQIINAVGARVSRGSATGTILNDDRGPGVTPTASFRFTPDPRNPLGVSFFDQSTDPDQGIVSWQWDFGDGTSSTLQNPVKTYAQAGTYYVRFTVTDVDGLWDFVTNPLSIAPPVALAATDQYLWLVPPASSLQRQGFVRLTNRQNTAGLVTVWGLDAMGRRSAGTMTLTLAPNESRHFNSTDMELGNPAKGLSGSFGEGAGDWTVIVRANTDIDASAYIRTPDGFLTSMHDRVDGDGVDWWVPIFNPADNPNQVSHLRVINTNTWPVSVIILGVDDAGVTGTDTLTLALPSLSATDLASTDLESGNAAKGLTGRLGNGIGKWHLSMSATGRISVQSLLSDPIGKLTNLSSLPDLTETTPGEKTLWFVPPASNVQQQGFVRLINRENRPSAVALWGIDDAGQRSAGTITLNLAALESRHLNSQDLESGNAAKGLAGSLGNGTGNWRLVVLTDLDLIPLALIRTPDGFLTTIHDTVAANGLTHRVPIFNPADNPNQVSALRLVNSGAVSASVTIQGVDDAGSAAPFGAVSFNLAAGAAVELTATDLENGNPAKGLGGRLGNGYGKWALTVTGAIKVLNLLRDPQGYLTNLSTSTKGTDAQLDP